MSKRTSASQTAAGAVKKARGSRRRIDFARETSPSPPQFYTEVATAPFMDNDIFNQLSDALDGMDESVFATTQFREGYEQLVVDLTRDDVDNRAFLVGDAVPGPADALAVGEPSVAAASATTPAADAGAPAVAAYAPTPAAATAAAPVVAASAATPAAATAADPSVDAASATTPADAGAPAVAASAPAPAAATAASAGSDDDVLDVDGLMNSSEDAILLQTNTFSGVIESPREVNVREFSLQMDKKRRIRMGIDLESFETFFHLTGEYVSPRYAYLALSRKEVYDLLEPVNFNRVSKEFTKPYYRYDSFMIGSLHFSFIKLRQFEKPCVRITRNYATQIEKKITLSEYAWSQFGRSKYLIEITFRLMKDSSSFIESYFKQFVKECLDYLREHKHSASSLMTMNLQMRSCIIRAAMRSTSSELVDLYSQIKSLTPSCYLPCIREEFLTFHVGYLTSVLFDRLKKCM